MKSLLFIKSLSDLEYAKKLELIDNNKIIAVSFDVYYKMQKEGINAIPIWEYASNSELQNTLQEDETIIDVFWKPFFQNSKYKDCFSIALFPLVFFVDEALASNLFIKNIVESEKPNRVINFTSKYDKPCVEGEWECTVFNSMMEFICKQKRIEYKKVINIFNRHQLDSVRDISSTLNYLFKYFAGILFAPFWFLYSWRYRGKIALSLVSEQEQKMRHQWFLDDFEKKSNLKILNLWDKTLKYIHIFNEGLFQKFIDKIKLKEDISTLKDEFYLFKENSRLYPEILENPLLNYHWDYLLKLCCKFKINATRQAKRKTGLFKPVMIFISQAHQPITIARSVAFKKKRIKTCLLPHSNLPYNQKYFYNYHDNVLATGRYQYHKFKALGVAPENIFTVNDKRYKAENSQKQNALLKEKYHVRNKKVITIITRNIQAGCGYFPKWEVKFSMNKMYEFIIACASLSKLGDNYQIIFKSHPLRDYYALYNQFKNKNIIHIRKKPVGELLDISDLVIIVGPLTDVLFEAAVKQKKIILCDCGIEEDIKHSLQNGVAVIDKPERLYDAVKKTLSLEKYKANKNHNIVATFLETL